MNPQIILVFVGIALVILLAVVIVYLNLRKKMQNSDVVRIKELQKGTQEKGFDKEVFYQKLYIKFQRLPFIKTYLLKIRRRLEINNIDDEFATRKQTAEIIAKALAIIIPLTIAVIVITHKNYLLMCIILIFELFIIDSITDTLVNKIDDALLEQQIDFFATMRHAYHENNMVAEAIYATAQDIDHVEIARQAERIVEILNSSDPEMELEKYYDVAPNNYLKEFAGISYLTQEFGDRKEGKSSLYLKNLDNISKEMQLEILKRDKLNYVFQSLSVIAIVPIIMLEPLKAWALKNFSFTSSFYNGSKGMLTQILIMVLTFIAYIFVRKLKDTGQLRRVQDEQNPWEERLYKKEFVKKFINSIMPKRKTKEYRQFQKLLKDSGSKKKMYWIYIDRVALSIVAFVVTIGVCVALHKIQVKYIYTEPTAEYNMIGEMTGAEAKKAAENTKKHNVFLKMFRGETKTTHQDIKKAMKRSKEYKGSSDKEIDKQEKMIFEKLQKINAEYLKWFEVLIALMIGAIGYMAPVFMLKFQMKIRQMEMEDEVMQYQTIIMMLMKIERVDVEMILEWIERYSDVFRDPISKCLNNYGSGAWESLEEMREEVNYQPFIRIIESLQTAVEKVPIKEAFEELDADRDYYQEKRKESNNRLIDKKQRIGKLIGFSPLVLAFVLYLIFPLVVIGMKSMNSTFDALQASAQQQ